MWSIEAFGEKQRDFRIHIPADDVVFVAVIKRGPTVHIGKSSVVRCYHLAEYDDAVRLGFSMSILDATATEVKYPDFSGEGIMGRWKLLSPKAGCTIPKIALIEIFENVNEFLNEALDKSNPEWIRSSYASIAESLIIKKEV